MHGARDPRGAHGVRVCVRVCVCMSVRVCVWRRKTCKLNADHCIMPMLLESHGSKVRKIAVLFYFSRRCCHPCEMQLSVPRLLAWGCEIYDSHWVFDKKQRLKLWYGKKSRQELGSRNNNLYFGGCRNSNNQKWPVRQLTMYDMTVNDMGCN